MKRPPRGRDNSCFTRAARILSLRLQRAGSQPGHRQRPDLADLASHLLYFRCASALSAARSSIDAVLPRRAIGVLHLLELALSGRANVTNGRVYPGSPALGRFPIAVCETCPGLFPSPPPQVNRDRCGGADKKESPPRFGHFRGSMRLVLSLISKQDVDQTSRPTSCQ